jgi:hypothetical protein
LDDPQQPEIGNALLMRFKCGLRREIFEVFAVHRRNIHVGAFGGPAIWNLVEEFWCLRGTMAVLITLNLPGTTDLTHQTGFCNCL